jgi:hypothetical protein
LLRLPQTFYHVLPCLSIFNVLQKLVEHSGRQIDSTVLETL